MRDIYKGALKFLAVVVVLVAIAAGILKLFFVDIVVVGHNAMAPTMIAGDRLLVWRSGGDYRMGDTLLCPHPSQPGRYVLGRVMGRPGATLEIARGQLRINGQAPDQDSQATMAFRDHVTGHTSRMRYAVEDVLGTTHGIFEREGRPLHMRPHRVRGGVFLLSDNRTFVGEDSRSFGEVVPSTCIGRVFMRLTPSEQTPPELDNGYLDIVR